MQCLRSIRNDRSGTTIEIIVVDNASTDGSATMVNSHFPNVQYIKNTENVGFSKANNIGIQKAKGKYVLLLNPDTILGPNCIKKCIEKAESIEKCGAIGVRLIDGKGHYLPESKRGYPGIWTSFCKFSGLGKLFPNSALFNGYYLGHLDKDEDHEIDVLCGAYMFIPMSTLETVGLLDETFFMYGEDIDLSYRIQKGGFTNHYISGASTVHYKGESTKKASFNYIRSFYGAMKIFVKKHFGGPGSWLYLLILQLAIIVFGTLSFLKNRFKGILPILADLALGLGVIKGISELWQFIVFDSSAHFSQNGYYVYMISAVLLLVLILYMIGHYDVNAKQRRYIWISLGTILSMLSVYALLPEQYRFSRGVLVLSIAAMLILFFHTKKVWNYLLYQIWRYEKDGYKRIVLVGKQKSITQLSSVIENGYPDAAILGSIYPSKESIDEDVYLSSIENLDSVARNMEANEIIFCSSDLSHQRIFEEMTKLGSRYSFTIAGLHNDGLLGASGKNEKGEWITEQVQYNITDPSNMRLKRCFDLIIGIAFIVCLPFVLILKKGRGLLNEAPTVIIGKKTWIGYENDENLLPSIRQKVLPVLPLSRFNLNLVSEQQILDQHYARKYSVIMDLEILMSYLFA